MILLNLLGVALWITGAVASPIQGIYDDEGNWWSTLNSTEDDSYDSWRPLLRRKDIWSWTQTTTAYPYTDIFKNYKDYNFNFTDYSNSYKPRDPLEGLTKYDGSDYSSSYGGSSSTTYTSWRTRSDYSGAIVIVLVVKFILILSCYGCRHRRPTPQATITRVPNNVQPSSLTVVRRHIFLVVPRNPDETQGNDSNDPASLLEQKTLVNEEDLPPSYEEVALSNADSTTNLIPNDTSNANNTSSLPAPPEYV